MRVVWLPHTPQRPFFGGDNSFIWTSNIPGLNLWYSVVKWPNNLLFKSRHLRMKGPLLIFTSEQLLTTEAILANQASWSPQWWARPSLEMCCGGREILLCLHKNRLFGFVKQILFSSLMHLCPEAMFRVKDMLVHWMEDEDLLDIMIFQSLPLTFTLVYWIRTALKATKWIDAYSNPR